MGSSEKVCISIVFSFWAFAIAVRARASGRERQHALPVFLNYAENVRRKLRAGILRPGLEPEGPHNTTEVISAKRAYHTLERNDTPIIHHGWTDSRSPRKPPRSAYPRLRPSGHTTIAPCRPLNLSFR